MGISSINGFSGSPPPAPPQTKAEAALAKAQAVKAAREAAFDRSPVQRMLDAQKEIKDKKVNYDETEDFLRMKAFEISNRIKLYKNLGLIPEYQQAQVEGTEVVKKYQALIKAGKIKPGGGGDTVA